MRLSLAAFALGLCAAAAGAQPPEGAEGWRGRMHRGSVFLSPMGEPFRSDDPAHDNVGDWFAAADTDHDGALTLVEMQADAARFYKTLDTNHDGEIDPDELTRYESEVAPEVQVGLQMGAGMGGFRGGGEGGWGGRGGGGGRRGGGMGRGGGGGGRGGWGGGQEGSGGGGGAPRGGSGGFDPGLQGAGRYSFLNIPEPVISADADLNRGVSLKEFLAAAGQRFVLLDRNHRGRVTREDLPPLPQRHLGKFKPDRKAPKTRTMGTPLPD
jgi:hypothetical protein